MADPVTIGNQTFIKTPDGWIDKKTKQPADKGLVALLDSVSSGEATKKPRVKIDRSKEPVTIAGTKYVYDLNQEAWIDEKTKVPAAKSLQTIITATVNEKATADILGVTPQEMQTYRGVIDPAFKQKRIEARRAAEEEVERAFGAIAVAGRQRVRKPSAAATVSPRQPGKRQPKAGNVKINSPIVLMIEKLASIDGYLKQRLDNQKKISARNIAQTKEDSIESAKLDAEPVKKVSKEDDTKSNATRIGVALLVGGLIASQFEPVQQAFKTLADGVKGVWNFVSNVAKTIADGLDYFTGTTSTSSSTTSLTGTRGGVSNTPPSSDLSPSDPNVVEEPSQGTPSEPNTVDASPVEQTQQSEPTQATPVQTNTEQPSRLGRTLIGASIGGAIAGPVGAVVGGAIGYFSAPSDSSGDSSSSPSQTATQATRTDAPAAGGTSNQALSRAVQLAAGQVGIGEAGIGNYLRQGGVGLDPRNEQWCAAFVNSTLAQSGLKGATNVANSFQKWGDNVPVSDVKEGDVVILTRGKGPDVTGGHVGIATGVRQGNRVEIIAGNTSNKVKKYFVEDNAKNSLQVRRYNPEKPYGAGAVGGAPLGSVGGALGSIVDAGIDLVAGAFKAIAGIAEAGLGAQLPRGLTDSLVRGGNTRVDRINTAATERAGDVAEARTPPSETPPPPVSPPNFAPTGSGTIQNMATASDYAGVDFYLIRMGVKQRRDAMAGMRA